MGKTVAAPASTPPSVHGGKTQNSFNKTAYQRNIFLVMVLNMTWQLAIVILVPIVAGVELDKALGTHTTLTFVGLGLAVVGSVAVLWRTVQRANRLPVPKLTEAQRRAIKKAYEEEDKDE